MKPATVRTSESHMRKISHRISSIYILAHVARTHTHTHTHTHTQRYVSVMRHGTLPILFLDLFKILICLKY